jgi:hypothetical protein
VVAETSGYCPSLASAARDCREERRCQFFDCVTMEPW